MTLDLGCYRRLFDNLYDGLYIVTPDRIILHWNKAAERITGYAAADVIGTSCADNILTHVDEAGQCLCTEMCPLAKTMANGRGCEKRVFLHHKDGHRIPVSVRTSTLTGEDGAIIGGVELFTDISDLDALTVRIGELEELAMLDKATRLANRSYIEKELLVHLEEQGRGGVPFGVVFMDIDHFKAVNDTYGHPVGDRVIRFVADTLARNSRPFDLFGRWGGDEFIGIIRNATTPSLETLGERLRALVASSYIQAQGACLHVSISIGATLCCKTDSLDSLMKRADRLLYESKAGGRNRLTIG